jgi:hypothetical protein
MNPEKKFEKKEGVKIKQWDEYGATDTIFTGIISLATRGK